MSRHIGVDLLRIVSMFMVVILHILGIGGILENTPSGSFHYFFFWSIETLCFVGVNCFALISGYFMIQAKWRVEKFLYLWFQVFFYSVLLSIVAQFILGSGETFSLPINMFFPLLTKSYWFFTAYAGLFLFVPILNKGLQQLKKEEFRYGVVIIFLLGTLSVFSKSDPFNMYKGYSMIWLIFMYIIGAYLKLHVDVNTIQVKKIWLSYWGVNGLSLCLIIFTAIIPFHEGIMERNWFIDYVSPLILSSSIFLFVIFLKLNITNKETINIVSKVAPFSFGVYLIHTHPIIFYFILKNSFVDLVDMNIWIAVIKIFAYGILIYVSCTLIDYVRTVLFKLFKIDVLAMFLGTKIQGLIGL